MCGWKLIYYSILRVLGSHSSLYVDAVSLGRNELLNRMFFSLGSSSFILSPRPP